MKFKILFPTGYQVTNIYCDNIDLHVILEDNHVYFGTFFTLDNIKYLIDREKDCCFWAVDMVIIKDLSFDTIYMAVAELLKWEHLGDAFTDIGPISKIYNGCSTFDDIIENSIK